jgi:hypothetical protein
MTELLTFRQVLRRLQRRADPIVLSAFVRSGGLDRESLQDRARIERVVAATSEAVRARHPDIGLEARLLEDPEHGRLKIVFEVRAGVATRAFTVDFDFLGDADYQRLCEIDKTVAATLGRAPFLTRELRCSAS